jgi:hypothetical protein
MTDTAMQPDEPTAPRWATDDDDGRGSLALAAGIAAALAGGLIWAGIVVFMNLEIGFAAWGVGALVGIAMARVTVRRSRALGVTAAGLAMAGLLVGKLLISVASTSAVTDELVATPAYLHGAVAWHMYYEDELDEATRDEVHATLAAGDTLSDAVWAAMLEQAAPRLEAMDDDERRAFARGIAKAYMGGSLVNAIRVQLSGWDLLWFGLAVVTAFQMMNGSIAVGQREELDAGTG